ncbi:hypothetical protein DFH28DRAFT_1067507 [Melampsora americana]|nr:hypothetical protein DFH28DRAFT_1067507 [Melampsora americana]
MIYTFGHLTPQSIHWKHFYCGARLCFNGNLVAKDPITGCFIVDVASYTIIGRGPQAFNVIEDLDLRAL